MTKVVFLDRDGTINVDSDEWWKIERWQFEPRAPEALRALQQAGFALAVVTNQGAIEHGRYTVADVERLHEHMQRLLADEGVTLDAIAYCPHAPERNCSCRKPEPGMARQIEAKLGPIDYAASWMIGDKKGDMLFGKNIGARTALIRSAYWVESDLPQQPDLIVDSLYDFSQRIL